MRDSSSTTLPAGSLGFQDPRPLVYYIHGGPQGQERPDFAWFSMPLIQFLTLRGFAVFVPNVRGSTGYGLDYTRQVDRDWGGQDRLDHVHAMTKVLPKDKRLDIQRAAVVGRSYGGYMTLTLAGRHPHAEWLAAEVQRALGVAGQAGGQAELPLNTEQNDGLVHHDILCPCPSES